MGKLETYLLENIEDIESIVRDINSWDGSLKHLDAQPNDEEFFDTFFEKPMEAIRASYYGNYNYNDDYVRFNGYGNLESFSEYEYIEELKDSIDEIAEAIRDNRGHIDLDLDIEDILDEE